MSAGQACLVRRHASVAGDLDADEHQPEAESFGYRQLLLLWRLEGFWQLIRKAEWGATERKGFSGQGGSADG